MPFSQRAQRDIQEKKRAALLSVGSALLLLCLKTFLVLRTGSLGVLSEALHSRLDLVAAVITFLSVRVSDQARGRAHPYGHGKFENFSALSRPDFLILTACYIHLRSLFAAILPLRAYPTQPHRLCRIVRGPGNRYDRARAADRPCAKVPQ